MSIIVAVEKGGRVAVSWDSMSSFGSTRCVNQIGPPKVLRAKSSLIGVTGFTVYRNLLDHYLASKKVPILRDERSVFEFFVEFWRDLHGRYHMIDDQHESEEASPFADLGAEFVVANRYGIFRVKEILNVSRVGKFCALGSGASHAEGALQVLYEQQEDAREIAKAAVSVALEFDAASGGPVEVLDIRQPPAQARKTGARRSRARTMK